MNEPSAIQNPMSKEDCKNFRIIELLFFAYRAFVSDADDVLAEYGFGRAHHRVLHFTNRIPGLTVAELLDILKITKQSLSRVLKELILSGHINQHKAANDGRKRLLFPTKKGRKLALKLSRMQSQRIDTALLSDIQTGNALKADTVEVFLHQMIDQGDRDFLDQLLIQQDQTE